MKKLFLLMLLPALLWSCGGKPEPKSPLVEEVQTLMAKYPNYETNDEARDKMQSDIKEFAAQFTGKPAPFGGVQFMFSKVIENPQTGAKSALFESRSALAQIDNPNAKGKYLIADVQIAVLGTVSHEVALSLDGNVNVRYSLSGIVHAYDENDPFFVADKMTGVYFGTFVVDDLKVERVEE